MFFPEMVHHINIAQSVTLGKKKKETLVDYFNRKKRWLEEIITLCQGKLLRSFSQVKIFNCKVQLRKIIIT